MTKKELIYEGKAKTLFFYDDDKIIQYFKDDATAFNKKKHEIINEKGILNNFISEFIFKYLSENGVENHFIERLNDREQLVKKEDIIPVEVIIRNIATGTLTKRLGIQEGLKLKKPLIEFTLILSGGRTTLSIETNLLTESDSPDIRISIPLTESIPYGG